MTIIKGTPLKPDKAILEKKLLQEALDEEPENEVRVTVTHLPQRQKRCCFNVLLILLALLVLSAGIISGIYLYKHLSRKIHKGTVRFTPKDEPYALPDQSAQRDDRNRKPDFHHPHHKPFEIEQNVEIDEQHYEKIHMPKFNSFRETLVLHDFTRNYSGIVDMDDRTCYVMNLNRKKITPPRDWFDLIRKFASGYYMPKASVLRHDYRVAGPPITDTSKYGVYIHMECQSFTTYWLEKKVGDGLIEKRSANGFKYFGYYDGKFIEGINIQM